MGSALNLFVINFIVANSFVCCKCVALRRVLTFISIFAPFGLKTRMLNGEWYKSPGSLSFLRRAGNVLPTNYDALISGHFACLEDFDTFDLFIPFHPRPYYSPELPKQPFRPVSYYLAQMQQLFPCCYGRAIRP
jgi:hypothetical protein